MSAYTHITYVYAIRMSAVISRPETFRAVRRASSTPAPAPGRDARKWLLSDGSLPLLLQPGSKYESSIYVNRYIYIYVHTHMYIRVCIHIYIYICVCMCVCTYVRMYVRTYVRTYVCMYLCMHVCMHACVHVNMYIHICV